MDKKAAHSLLILFWLNVFTLSLASMVSFFLIGNSFSNISFLGLALSLRTLSSSISSYFIPFLTRKITTKKTLLFSQLFSFAVLATIFFGFYYKNYFAILFGVAGLGIPYVTINILITVYLKSLDLRDDEFRKNSGYREAIFGMARLFSCIVSPVLVLYSNIHTIMLFIFFMILFCLFFTFKMKNFSITKIYGQKNEKSNINIFSYTATWNYIFKSSAVLLLIALIPLAASSNNLAFTSDITPIIRQLLWALEAGMMIIASFIYIKLKKIVGNSFFANTFALNALLLLPMLFFKSITLLFIVCILISLFMMIGFYTLRDDYILQAKDNEELIKKFSAFSSTHQYCIYTISPLLLSYFFLHFSLLSTIIVILFLQILFLTLSSLFSTFSKKHDYLKCD